MSRSCGCGARSRPTRGGRLAVVEPGDEAQRHLVVVQVVEEGAVVGVGVQRPACGVQHEAGPVFGRIDLPQLLDADSVALRGLATIDLVPGDELLTEAAALPFSEHRVLRMQFHAELEVLARLAVLADTAVAGCHALDRPVGVVERLGRGEAGEYATPIA